MRPDERWLPITGYEDRYEVSDLGRVRKISDAYRSRITPLAIPVVLTSKRQGKGYRGIDLARNGKKSRRYIHDLVLEAFVGLAPPRHQGAHGDGERTNNRLTNLAWKTSAANHADKRRHGTQPLGERCHNSKLTDAAVRSIRASTERLAVLAARFGVSKGLVSQIKNNIGWEHVT